MPVEIGPVHAREFHRVTDGNAAGTAHARTIHHYGIEADHRPDSVGTGKFGAGFHHRERADGDYLVDILMLFQDLVQNYSHKTLCTVRSVVGSDKEFIRISGKAVIPEHEFLAAEPDDGNCAGTEFLVAP